MIELFVSDARQMLVCIHTSTHTQHARLCGHCIYLWHYRFKTNYEAHKIDDRQMLLNG